MSVRSSYLEKMKAEKTKLKVFLSNATMLRGIITNFDEDVLVLDECLVDRDKIVSITPMDR